MAVPIRQILFQSEEALSWGPWPRTGRLLPKRRGSRRPIGQRKPCRRSSRWRSLKAAATPPWSGCFRKWGPSSWGRIRVQRKQPPNCNNNLNTSTNLSNRAPNRPVAAHGPGTQHKGPYSGSRRTRHSAGRRMPVTGTGTRRWRACATSAANRGTSICTAPCGSNHKASKRAIDFPFFFS